MILVDLNQLLLSGLLAQISKQQNVPLEESLVRHMVLNTIRANVKKFKEYGEVVIACDNKRYWRREIFPAYKANRKKNRDASGHDWTTIFECMAKIKQELKTHSPYKVIDVDGAEADDVIGALVRQYSSREPILILSSDKDFVQLQAYCNVKQYSPILKKFIKTDDPNSQLKELIIRGDSGDGIPNVLSPDNCLVEGMRQKPITKKILLQLMDVTQPTSESVARNWDRNSMLIDLNKMPESISKSIIDTYSEVKPASRQQFMNYMIQNRLKNLLEVIDEF